jgi:hypothetical protein
MENVLELRSTRAALKEFVEDAGIDSKKLKKMDTNWIASAAFTFVIGNEQEGWKAARVAEFLYGFKEVPIKDLAEQMRKLGGIEKIVRLAAKEDPRRPPPSSGTKAGSARQKHAKVTKDEAPESDPDDDWEEPADDDASKSDHDRPEVMVRLTSALLTKLRATRPGRRVKLVGVRPTSAGPSACALEIEEVRRVRT